MSGAGAASPSHALAVRSMSGAGAAPPSHALAVRSMSGAGAAPPSHALAVLQERALVERDTQKLRAVARADKLGLKAKNPYAFDQKPMSQTEIIAEEDFVDGIDAIIERDFFPDLPKLRLQERLLKSTSNEESAAIKRELRLLQELGPSGASDRSRLVQRADGGKAGSSTSAGYTSLVTKDLSLDQYLAKYTSEDNWEFRGIMAKEKAKKAEKQRWIEKKEETDRLRVALRNAEKLALEYGPGALGGPDDVVIGGVGGVGTGGGATGSSSSGPPGGEGSLAVLDRVRSAAHEDWKQFGLLKKNYTVETKNADSSSSGWQTTSEKAVDESPGLNLQLAVADAIGLEGTVKRATQDRPEFDPDEEPGHYETAQLIRRFVERPRRRDHETEERRAMAPPLLPPPSKRAGTLVVVDGAWTQPDGSSLVAGTVSKASSPVLAPGVPPPTGGTIGAGGSSSSPAGAGAPSSPAGAPLPVPGIRTSGLGTDSAELDLHHAANKSSSGAEEDQRSPRSGEGILAGAVSSPASAKRLASALQISSGGGVSSGMAQTFYPPNQESGAGGSADGAAVPPTRSRGEDSPPTKNHVEMEEMIDQLRGTMTKNPEAMALVTQSPHAARNALYFHQGEAKYAVARKLSTFSALGMSREDLREVSLPNSRFPKNQSELRDQQLAAQEEARRRTAVEAQQDHKFSAMAEHGVFGRGPDGMGRGPRGGAGAVDPRADGTASVVSSEQESLFLRTPSLVVPASPLMTYGQVVGTPLLVDGEGVNNSPAEDDDDYAGVDKMKAARGEDAEVLAAENRQYYMPKSGDRQDTLHTLVEQQQRAKKTMRNRQADTKRALLAQSGLTPLGIPGGATGGGSSVLSGVGGGSSSKRSGGAASNAKLSQANLEKLLKRSAQLRNVQGLPPHLTPKASSIFDGSGLNKKVSSRGGAGGGESAQLPRRGEVAGASKRARGGAGGAPSSASSSGAAAASSQLARFAGNLGQTPNENIHVSLRTPNLESLKIPEAPPLKKAKK